MVIEVHVVFQTLYNSKIKFIYLFSYLIAIINLKYFINFFFLLYKIMYTKQLDP